MKIIVKPLETSDLKEFFVVSPGTDYLALWTMYVDINGTRSGDIEWVELKDGRMLARSISDNKWFLMTREY